MYFSQHCVKLYPTYPNYKYFVCMNATLKLPIPRQNFFINVCRTDTTPQIDQFPIGPTPTITTLFRTFNCTQRDNQFYN